jgi:hypothetical protein
MLSVCMGAAFKGELWKKSNQDFKPEVLENMNVEMAYEKELK